jgi:hypothetical protein
MGAGARGIDQENAVPIILSMWNYPFAFECNMFKQPHATEEHKSKDVNNGEI